MATNRYPFLTGTRAYGPARDDSDWDVVMFAPDAQMMQDALLLARVKVHQPNKGINLEYEGFYFYANGRMINIIAVTDEEWGRWMYATFEMQKIPPIENRETRLKAFKDLLEKGYTVVELSE